MRTLPATFATLVLLLGSTPAHATPLGTAFTYQGQLKESGQPASGVYDLQVCLFDSPFEGPSPLACAPDFDNIPVDGGLFALTLDFGAAPFAGEVRYLELRVRPGGSIDTYTVLEPRQPIRPSPEALHAASAPWSGLSEVPAGFADGIDSDSGGTVTSLTAGTGLSGGTITGSGVISIADGGVGPNQLALGSVGPDQLAPNMVGLDQIDPTQVQSRVAGTCAGGEYIRGINADGTVICEPVPGVLRITAVDDPASQFGRYTSIAIGVDGLPVISYWDLQALALKVAKCVNAACTGSTTIATVDDPANSVGQHTSIAIGTDGLPVISYYDDTADALKVAKCVNAACTGSATITTVDDPGNNVGFSSSIAIGIDGLPVISYHDGTAGALKVAKCVDEACTGNATITTVDDPGNIVGAFTSIAISTDGLPVISYYDQTAGSLQVAKCANAACTGGATITTVDDPGNHVGRDISIAIGTDDLPVISYLDDTADALKVAKCANASCTGLATITTVDDPANLLFQSSIAIGIDGLPVISYYDATAGALKVARCATAACTGSANITTVEDPANDVGGFSSIAIGTDGLPVISYHDATTDALKVAKCGTRSCE